MNLHQMKKCKEWVKKYCPTHDTMYPTAFVEEKLYEFIMPYRRNVQSLKKKLRFQRGEIAREIARLRNEVPWFDPSVKWVCEKHPTKPMSHKIFGLFKCGGAGQMDEALRKKYGEV